MDMRGNKIPGSNVKTLWCGLPTRPYLVASAPSFSISMPACAELLRPDVAIRKFFRRFRSFNFCVHSHTCNSSRRGLARADFLS
jgi:hypothetical protein